MDLLQSVHVGALILDQGPLTWFLSEVPSSSEILLKKNYNLYFQHRNSVFVFLQRINDTEFCTFLVVLICGSIQVKQCVLSKIIYYFFIFRICNNDKDNPETA